MRIDYRDDKNLPRVVFIQNELMKAIKTSGIAIVVFSKNYASSKWCHNELVKIMECRKKFKQRVLPIFYHVSPSDVREQKGKYREALQNGHENQVKRWSSALRDAARKRKTKHIPFHKVFLTCPRLSFEFNLTKVNCHGFQSNKSMSPRPKNIPSPPIWLWNNECVY